MIGEIAAGVILGPSALALIHFTPEIKAIADLGVFLLVFLGGMEMDLGVLWKAFRGRGALVGLAGFTIPLALGISVGNALHMGPTQTISVGLCIPTTALPVRGHISMARD